MKTNKYGRFFSEFKVGDIYNHDITKTITDSDNNLFSLLTMNHHPVHLDKDYAENRTHGQILVVGTLVFSLVVGITVSDVSGKAVANLDYENIKHLRPVFIGDTIRAVTEVLESRESKSNSNNGIVYVKTIAYNQKNDPVLSFKRHILIPKKNSDA